MANSFEAIDDLARCSARGEIPPSAQDADESSIISIELTEN
jgi:hypothetical protein